MKVTTFYSMPFEGARYRLGCVIWSGKNGEHPWAGKMRKPGGKLYAVTRHILDAKPHHFKGATMKYLLVLLTIPFLFGFCDIYSTCQVPSYLDMPKVQPPRTLGYGANSPSNPYSTNPPKIYAPDGTYLGQLSANPHLPESTSNPNGLYGSTWGTNSIHNPNGLYGGKRKGY